MRRICAWTLLLALMLTSCGGEKSLPSAPPKEDRTALEVAGAILDSQSDGGDYTPLSKEDEKFYVNQLYGIGPDLYNQAAVYTAGGTDAREIAVLRLFETGDMTAVETGMETYRQNRIGDFLGYDPEQVNLVEKGRLAAVDRYVALLICTDPDGAVKAFGEYLDRPLAEPAPTPAVTAKLDVSGFPPFDPPREFDMTLYDDAPIVRAFHTGDERGLDGKQTAILEKCREIFDTVLTDGMTDFQKELALYRYVTACGEYDETHYDPRTPLGRPDNTNPYGLLLRGYATCVGFAETFRLLMDLAGVECVTVTGAAYGSSEDHAWNMVKLEGEWYCVDPTWDGSSPYRYFNVTSDWLRKTDHQWDYANVPEAIATRFHWDGTGPLPD